MEDPSRGTRQSSSLSPTGQCCDDFLNLSNIRAGPSGTGSAKHACSHRWIDRDGFDNSVAESFFATLQTELLDRSTWPTRDDLANAVFAFIEGSYNPRRRHSTLGYLSPADYEIQHQAGRSTRTAA